MKKSHFLVLAMVFTTASVQGESIGSDANGAWLTETRTNLVYHGTDSVAVGTVVTNRITQEEYQWRQKVASVHMGMRREDVEKILPPFTQPEIGVGNSSGYSLKYPLDEHWMVAMWYDVTGLRGKTVTNRFAENRLVIPPDIARIKTSEQDLESRCLSYHMEHHRDDEQAAKMAGAVEFTGYRISVAHVEAGEALVGIKVVSHKYIGHAPYPQFASTDGDGDWQERWRKTKDGWAFIKRVSEPNWIIIYR